MLASTTRRPCDRGEQAAAEPDRPRPAVDLSAAGGTRRPAAPRASGCRRGRRRRGVTWSGASRPVMRANSATSRATRAGAVHQLGELPLLGREPQVAGLVAVGRAQHHVSDAAGGDEVGLLDAGAQPRLGPGRVEPLGDRLPQAGVGRADRLPGGPPGQRLPDADPGLDDRHVRLLAQRRPAAAYDPSPRPPDRWVREQRKTHQQLATIATEWFTVQVTERYIAAIDQGTTSSRCIVFDAAGAHRRHRPARAPPDLPRPGWVEHDADRDLAQRAGR